jgi:hypothetical protein
MTILSPSAHDIILRQTLYGMLTGWIPVPFADLIAPEFKSEVQQNDIYKKSSSGVL